LTTHRATPVSILALAVLLAGAIATLTPMTLAGGSVSLDAATLNELLPALTPGELEVELAGGQTVTVLLENLEITGFDPAAGDESSGQILTRLRVKIPDLGLAVPVEPRLSLGVLETGGETLLELRFERADLSLPLIGAVDIGKLIPPMRFPAESVFLLEGVSGDVPMRSRVTAVKMGQKVLRFDFELERAE
jgi:hypothetical protein